MSETEKKVPWQETFDRVVKALREQGVQSISRDSKRSCMYRWKTADGQVLKCAAGHLIPDELYQPIFEGIGIAKWVEKDSPEYRVSKCVSELGHDLDLVRELQMAHDLDPPEGKTWLEMFLQEAREIASNFGLDPKEAM